MQGPDHVVLMTEMVHHARVMVSDPGLWDVGWSGEFPMELSDEPMIEFACHEGNYGIANPLRGFREDEKSGNR
jgi:hypothetical protein